MSQLISDVHLVIATLRQPRLDCVGWCRQSDVSFYGVWSNRGCAEYGSSVVSPEFRWKPNCWMWYCGILRRIINMRKWRIGFGWKRWSQYEINRPIGLSCSRCFGDWNIRCGVSVGTVGVSVDAFVGAVVGGFIGCIAGTFVGFIIGALVARAWSYQLWDFAICALIYERRDWHALGESWERVRQ